MSSSHDYTHITSNHPLRKNFFPYNLLDMLSSDYFADCLRWRDDGEAFLFLDKDKLADKLEKINPRGRKYKKRSFLRKLNRWGFKMDKRKGPNYGMYSHSLFKRDMPWLCEKMTCEKSDDHLVMDTPSIESEVKVCGMDMRYETNDGLMHEESLHAERPVKRARLHSSVAYLNTEYYHKLSLEDKIQFTELLIDEKLRSLGYYESLKSTF